MMRQQTTPAPADQVIVLFGATGDLAKRKLLPGMFHLAQGGLMPKRFRIIGAARKGIDDGEFQRLAREAIDDSGRDSAGREALDGFAGSLRFAGVGDGFEPLAEAIEQARRELDGEAELLFYLSLPPQAAEGTVEQIGALGLGEGARVITEKPPTGPLKTRRSAFRSKAAAGGEHRRRRGTEKGPLRGPVFREDVPPKTIISLARRSSSFRSSTP
jgi:glucose-6-phosphate 1-dehydrogenase